MGQDWKQLSVFITFRFIPKEEKKVLPELLGLEYQFLKQKIFKNIHSPFLRTTATSTDSSVNLHKLRDFWGRNVGSNLNLACFLKFIF